MITIIETYKGNEISLADNGIFEAAEFKSDTLKGIKELIDKQQKIKKEIWYLSFYHIYKAVITSVSQDKRLSGYGPNYSAWISYKDTNGQCRTKTCCGLYEITDKNNEIAQKVIDINKQLDLLEKQREKICDTLEKDIYVPKLIKEKEEKKE